MAYHESPLTGRNLMRFLFIAFIATSCLVPTPDKPSTPEVGASAGDANEKTDKPKIVVERFDKKADPILPPPPKAGLQGVDIVGHGLRITIYPPFQVGLTEDYVHGFIERDEEGGIILSWWDVTHPGNDRTSGMAGLHNAGVAVHPVPESTEIIKTTLPWPNGESGVAYRRGTTGSYVLLPTSLVDAGGMLTVSAGPADDGWSVEHNGQKTPLENRKLLHSADPAKGQPFDNSDTPYKPWGPLPMP